MGQLHRNMFCFIPLFAAAFIDVTHAASYTHLGCYHDKEDPGLRDLNGLDITKTEIDLHECLETCRKRGYPYAGLQAIAAGGFKCYCGDVFGKWGKASNSYRSCNYTCGASGSEISCGGILANDVYYTVRIDSTYTDTLTTVFHASGKKYTEARQQCVQNGGDLAIMETNELINSSSHIVQDGGLSSGHVWFGLRQRFMNSSSEYEWVLPQAAIFDIGSYLTKFHLNSIVNPCVALIPELKLWKSTSCQIPYPFLCKQLPPGQLATTPVPTEDPNGNTDDEGSGSNMLSLYIVMPLFAFCYGGSCIMYCSYKAYRSCKRQKREKMLLTNIEVVSGHEYEPDNKPRPPPRPNSANRGRVFPAPPPGHPAARPGFRPPPPHNKPPPRPPGYHQPPPPKPAQATTPRDPPETSRPATSRGVELQVQETPRGKPEPPPPDSPVKTPVKSIADNDEFRTKSRADKKREKLLEKALKEARERRHREGANVTPTGSREPQRSRTPMTPVRPGEDPASSGDSSTNLLKDGKGSPVSTGSGQSQDPTQMSISDILKMKMNSRRRAKKIIQA